jgi:hypothetical protein
MGMSLRPIDTDVLEDVCGTVARQNYGFIYINDNKTAIKNGYEQADTGTLKAGELSISDIRKGLSEIAADDFTDFEQIREAVFYMDQFGAVGNEEITEELTLVFNQHLVVTGERLRSAFSLAIDDLDFFVDELESREYLQRIRAGQNDYYTIGPKLEERADDVGLDSQLAQDAVHGKISHSDLEDVIDVSATTDVIRYLEKQDLIIDLDGEYFVQSLSTELAAHLAGEIKDAIVDEFETAKHILEAEEFEQVVTNEIRERFDILSYLGEVQQNLIDETVSAAGERIGIEMKQGMAIQSEEFNQYTTSEARRIFNDVKAEIKKEPGKLDGWAEAAEEYLEEVRVSNTSTVNNHIRSVIKEQYIEVVNEEEFGGMGR